MHYTDTISPKLKYFYKITPDEISVLYCMDGQYFNNWTRYKENYIKSKFTPSTQLEWEQAKELLIKQIEKL